MFHHHSIIGVILSHTLGSSVFCNSHDIYITGSFMCFFPCLPLEPEIVIYMSQSYYCHCGSDDCDHSDIGEDPAGAQIFKSTYRKTRSDGGYRLASGLEWLQHAACYAQPWVDDRNGNHSPATRHKIRGSNYLLPTECIQCPMSI